MPRGKRTAGSVFERQLTKMIGTLQEQRKTHADALASIDGLFARIGITTHLAGDTAPARRGRPPGKRGPGRPAKSETTAAVAAPKAKHARRGKRDSYATTASETIITSSKTAVPKAEPRARSTSTGRVRGDQGTPTYSSGRW